MNLQGEIIKQIGDARINVGDYSMKFLLGWPRIYSYSWTYERSGTGNYFIYPIENQSAENRMDDSSEWEKLEKLPEGTVGEAYLSFEQFLRQMSY